MDTVYRTRTTKTNGAVLKRYQRQKIRDLVGDGLVWAGFGAGSPYGQHERDLVDEISNVVDHVEGLGGDISIEISEVVAQWVDGPAESDDEFHVVKSAGNSLISSLSEGLLESVGLAGIDLKEDEGPSSHSAAKSDHGVDHLGLTSVSEGKHDHCADEQTPEHCTWWALGKGGLGSTIQNQVELDHLQRHGDGPVNVTVNHGGLLDLHPEFTHVEVMHTCN